MFRASGLIPVPAREELHGAGFGERFAEVTPEGEEGGLDRLELLRAVRRGLTSIEPASTAGMGTERIHVRLAELSSHGGLAPLGNRDIEAGSRRVKGPQWKWPIRCKVENPAH